MSDIRPEPQGLPGRKDNLLITYHHFESPPGDEDILLHPSSLRLRGVLYVRIQFKEKTSALRTGSNENTAYAFTPPSSSVICSVSLISTT